MHPPLQVANGVQAQADKARQVNLEQYTALKGRILKITAALIAFGLAAAAATGGADAAEAFALGGAIALVYQLMINRSVDSLPLGSADAQPPRASDTTREWRKSSSAHAAMASATGGGSGVTGFMVAGAAAPRIALVASVLLAAVWGTQSWDSTLLPPACMRAQMPRYELRR